MRSVAMILATVVAVAMAGCGGTGTAAGPGPSADANRAARQLLAPGLHTVPTPPPSGFAADGTAVRVIRAWSEALRAGHVRAAASYFSTPSAMVNGVGPGGTLGVIRIGSLRQAIAANETLPCGAQFLSADQRGRYVNALFKLTGRRGPGGNSCGGGAGQTARTNFLIVHGRIVEWFRAPDDPGDNRGGSAPGGSGTTGGPLV